MAWETLTPGPGASGPQGPTGPIGPQGPAAGPHHATHEPGGADAIVALNLTRPYSTGNPQIMVQATVPMVSLIETTQPVNARLWRIFANSQALRFTATDDAETANSGAVTIDRSGVLTAAAGLGTTPLNGSQVTSGTIPDARHSANVALKNIDNNFIAQTFASGSYIAGSASILVFTDPNSPVDARVWRVINYGDGVLRIQALNDAATIVQGEFLIGRAGGIQVGGTATINGPIVGTTSVIAPAFNAAVFSGNGGMTWTVTAGNATTWAYSVVKKVMTVFFHLVGTSVGGTLTNLLIATIPGGFVANRTIVAATLYCLDNGVPGTGFMYVLAGGTQIFFGKTNQAAWTASASNTQISGEIIFEVQ